MPQGRENRLLRHAALGYDGPADPIFARTQYGRAWVGFVLENRTCAPADQVERARIGLHNIPAMRRNMSWALCGERKEKQDILADAYQFSDEDLRRRRAESVQNVRKTNGRISLEQRVHGAWEEDDEWQD